MRKARGAPELAVSIVVYRPDLEVLERALRALRAAVEQAAARRALQTTVFIADNSPEAAPFNAAAALLREAFGACPGVRTEFLVSGGNIGYGRANNLAIARSRADYHLVMNPDVFPDPDALDRALDYLETHPGAGLLLADVRGEDGERHHLCKRNPTLFDLFLRGFAPDFLRRAFARRMGEFEMRDRDYDAPIHGVAYPTGCFMFFRGEVLRRLGGFDPRFFMYLEDADIGRRTLELADVVYVPAVRVVHRWARGSHREWRLRWVTIQSGYRYWRKWGGLW
jgi:GT2 family glycosyltransferase